MLRSIIQAQIEDGDHDEALAIIAKYGDKDFADRFRGMVRTSFTEQKIGQYLKDWLSALPDDEPPIKDSGSHLMGIEGITINKNDCVKQRDHLRAQLEDIPSDAERLEAAREIVALTKRINDAWDDINTIKSGGAIVKEGNCDQVAMVFEGVTSKESLRKILNNYKSYLSPSKKRSREKILFYKKVVKEAGRRIDEC